MCGIAGIIRISSSAATLPPDEAIPQSWLDLLDDGIKHRGPDGHGSFRDRAIRPGGYIVDVALIHRRLSTIDLADGHQPMVVESRSNQGNEHRLAVVFNGFIYNHRDLRAQLQNAGHVFKTDHSDTEVLLHGWRQWGLGKISYSDLSEIRSEGLCSRLDGMFAFAMWDSREARLTLCRDQHGEKPLYHTLCVTLPGGSLVYAFASAAAPLTRWHKLLTPAHPVSRVVDDWIREGYATDLLPVIECRPRESLTLGVGLNNPDSGIPDQIGDVPLTRPAAEFEPAGSVPNHSQLSGPTWRRTHDLSVEELDGILDKAVQSRLDCDVPLGCFLSGGVDSSLIAFYARRALGKLKTFTVKMPAAAYDESPFAEHAARTIGTDHTTLECNPRPAEDLVKLIATLGLPFGDSSLLPTYWVSRAARAHVTVALSGDGGDELFAGYERYQVAGVLSRYRPLFRMIPSSLVTSSDPKSRASKLQRLIEAAKGSGYEDLRAIFSQSQCRELGIRQSPFWRQPGQFGLFEFNESAIDRAIASDCRDYLPGDLMRKTDTASMSVALEVRAPFLANAVTAAARSATIDSLMPGGERKGLLRALARKYLPAEIVDRPKQGFAIPIGEWFRSDFGGMKTLLLDTLNSADPFPEYKIGFAINRGAINRMVNEHMQQKCDHSQRLYMLLVLGIWVKLVQ